MKHVLIPTDFSENAWNAINYAIHLFKDQRCTFYLLNTYTPVIPTSRFMGSLLNETQSDNTIKNASETGLKNTLARIHEVYEYPNHYFESISSFNLLVDEIKDLVDTLGVDLIVTGTKGASSMESVFMGSNTVRIIKSVTKCPVLAVPQNFHFISPSEIAFATDFNRFYTLSELKPLIELAKAFSATVRIVYVQYHIKALTELQQFNLDMLRKYLSDVAHYVHTVSELHSVSKTLEVFSEELGIHLLALLNYKHSYMEQITHEPIVKRAAFHSQIPILVIPELGMEVLDKKENRKVATIEMKSGQVN